MVHDVESWTMKKYNTCSKDSDIFREFGSWLLGPGGRENILSAFICKLSVHKCKLSVQKCSICVHNCNISVYMCKLTVQMWTLNGHFV